MRQESTEVLATAREGMVEILSEFTEMGGP
jgi:hypothetical protein